jgi:HEAT repeat protein
MIILSLFRFIQPIFQIIRENFSARVSSVQRGISTSIEQRYRQDMIKLVQDKHLTAPLFSLEEIASEPLLLAPPPRITPGGAIPTEDLTDIAVPYLPDISTVGGRFFVKTLTIPQAMAEGENLLLIGQPGSGKSFSINLLTHWIAQRNPNAGHLNNLIPISVHVADLDLPAKRDKVAEVLYKALSDRVSILVENRLLDFYKASLQAKNCLVMVDGLDELPAEDQKPVIEYLQALQKVYPGNRYIIAAGLENISSMNSLDLFPIALAGWTPKMQKEYVHRWSDLWTEHIASQSWARDLPEIFDSTILNRWILEDAGFDTPFYLMMRTWAAYAGDAHGPGNVNAIEAYLQRMTDGKQNERGAMEQLALQITLTQTPILTRRAAGSYVAAFEEDEVEEEEAVVSSTVSAPDPLEDEDLDALLDELDELDMEFAAEAESQAVGEEEEGEPESAEDVSKREVRRMLPNLVDARVLVFRHSNKVSFIHPIFCGYLAAANLARQHTPSALSAQKDWIGKTLAESFLSSQAIDLSKMIADKAQAAQSEPLKQSLIQTSSWLQNSPKTAGWRPTLMRSLAAAMQQENLPLGIRVRILSGLAASREPTVGKLFKQMIHSPKHSVRWLGALGCGMIKDQEAVLELGKLLYDQSIFVSRAACLSLVTVGTTRALEMITTALLEANEEVRRAAAEALSLHPQEGYAVLKEGVTIDDVLVRRAVVFGLARVEEPWARETLEQVVVEDDEWLVRNAALQIVEESKTSGPLVPKPIPPIHELPWLISFATERGMGVSPGQGAWDMLETVLKEGNEEQRLAAMQIYRRKPGEAFSVVNPLLKILKGPESEIREAAYITLWHLQAAGVNLSM